MESADNVELLESVGSEHIAAMAAGAALIGSGGGGDVTIGARLLQRQLAGSRVAVRPAASLAPDGLVVHVGVIGSPDVLAEQLLTPADLATATRQIVRHVGADLAAVGIIEIGGVSALLATLAASVLDVPVLDGDLMGRAYPQVTQTTLHLAGEPMTPLAMVSAAGDVLVFTGSTRAARRVLAATVPAMGGLAALAFYPSTPRKLDEVGVRHSLSRCVQLGAAYLSAAGEAAGGSRADFVALLGGELICESSVDELHPRYNGLPGSLTLSTRYSSEVVRIDHLDEFLAVTVDGKVVSRTPDIIIALESSSLKPLRSNEIRLGQNLTVFSIPPMHAWPDAAQSLVGTDGFGLHLESVA